jgi:hypothetical protein
MRQEHEVHVTADPLSLSELLTRYVGSQVGRLEEGGPGPDLGGEVSPHDAGSAVAIEPRLAWDEAVAALTLSGSISRGTLPAPGAVPDWKNLVASQEPALDLAFCSGNFPQMVRNLSLLLQGFSTDTQEEEVPGRRFETPGLVAWARQLADRPFPQTLLAVGLLRLAGEYDLAAAVLTDKATEVPAEWRAAWVNEEAALAWHAGRREEAVERWQSQGDRTHVPTLFNLGMAALFLGRPTEARGPLSQAVARIPENNSWHHLARLYLTLAEMRVA